MLAEWDSYLVPNFKIEGADTCAIDTNMPVLFSRIQYRINAAKVGNPPKRLMPFAGNPRQEMPHGLPFTLPDYLQLVDINLKPALSRPLAK
ncbi:hypothetical protein BM524_08685 [Alteromonas mediterranea]|uniref:Uncharacterized protein n=1 Tax=Alteromonas mediterranea TaxID=314275 RepID=A0AAC9JA00_9ALTE|nr:hypothetical protein BM524_08685 [Alteromonas mediterranea]